MVQHILNQFVFVYLTLTEVICSLLACSVFELVSAYGTVGLSLGIPDVGHIRLIMHSLIADRHFSKTILCLGNLTL